MDQKQKQPEAEESNSELEKNEEPGVDEIFTEGSESQLSDQENGEMDFSKPTPKNMLPGSIKSFKPMRIKQRKVKFGEDCGSCEESEDDEMPEISDETPRKKRKQEKDENLTTKRAVALFMIFPMLVTGAFMGYDMLGKFKFGKTAIQLISAVAGAVIALFFMAKVEALRSAVKFVLCFAWVIFFIPTYQVYSCSPVELKNDMLGTWFSLKTEANDFLEKTYITSNCMRSSKFPTPYRLSLMSLKVSLKVDISELINLNMEKEVPDDDAQQSLIYFLLVSKRSVKKKFHKLYFILEAAPKLATTLAQSLKLSAEEKDKNLLLITGSISDIDDALMPMKNELESMNYLIRPINFRVHSVKYVSRYVKLRNEDLY